MGDEEPWSWRGTLLEQPLGMKAVACLVLLAGCDLYFGPSGGPEGSVDAGLPPVTNCGRPYTATIFEPADGAVLSPSMTTRVRWNQPNIPDRSASMSDHYGNYFIPHGPGDIQGDGSVVDHYELPANGAFIFEIGWLCDVEHDGKEAVLARVEFTTGP